MKKGPNKRQRDENANNLSVTSIEDQRDLKKPTSAITYDEFVNACRVGDLITVERAIATLSVGVITDYNNHAFQTAAVQGHYDVVNRLLMLDAVLAKASADDNLALRWASISGHFRVVNRLLEIDSVKDAAAVLENYTLLWAAFNGYFSIVVRLLKIDVVKAGAAINENKIIACAAENNHFNIVNRLLEIDAVRNAAAVHSNELLSCAARKGQLMTVNLLLEIDSVKRDVTTANNEILRFVIEAKHYPVAIRLLKEQVVRTYVDEHQPELLKKESEFSKARQQYAKAKTAAFLVLQKQTPLPLFLRLKILQEVFHDIECGKSSCFKAEPSDVTNPVSLCLLFKGAAKPARPLVELLDSSVKLTIRRSR